MSHSKRNTSLAFFTNYERSQLKDRWGSQKARLTRESFLPLASCHLCLQSAREPVACRDGGHIFCKECAVTNLLAQKKEISRLEKEDERRRDEEKEAELVKADEAQDEDVKAFERTQAGLAQDTPSSTNKRKLESGEEDIRSVARRKLDDEKSSKTSQPFWMPSSMDSATKVDNTRTRSKLQPSCPSASSTAPHALSLKALVPVKFSTSTSINTSTNSNTATTEVNGKSATIICPACKKALSPSTKTTLTVPCGHVICKTCTDQFMKSPAPPSAGKHGITLIEDTPLVCYVCQTNLTEPKEHKKDGKKSKEKDKLKPGLVELSTQGTGFAGAGQAVVDKEGVAFHFG